ncbi:hypothetical protein EGR_10977 [Echinococcus granulosus]|uniref:Uncharacterized protein n=1 Tax=Echinococcus granulosus TaxID=6210 RepID=W6U724_ECHGR|nr:hypothetical protein EGR_10977 [Echinococcus granulosus]EUB54167.1 hypothetical protein EGR_10977 [Echinococcus granulosus]
MAETAGGRFIPVCCSSCNVCQHPAPALRDCQHCAVRVCSSCWDSHYVKVVTSVTESIRVLLEKKKDLEEVRNLLKARSHGEASHLRKFIEQATLVLRNACNKSLNLSTANLNNLFAEHRARLNASKGAVCNIRELIKKYAGRKQLIPLMTLDTLLDMRDALEGVSSIAKRTSEGLDACTKRPNLRVDRSLTGALDTLSLIDVAHQAESKHRRSIRSLNNDWINNPESFRGYWLGGVALRECPALDCKSVFFANVRSYNLRTFVPSRLPKNINYSKHTHLPILLIVASDNQISEDARLVISVVQSLRLAAHPLNLVPFFSQVHRLIRAKLFQMVIFGNFLIYFSLPAVVKLALDDYCNTNRVVFIAFFQNAHTLRGTPGNDDFAMYHSPPLLEQGWVGGRIRKGLGKGGQTVLVLLTSYDSTF